MAVTVKIVSRGSQPVQLNRVFTAWVMLRLSRKPLYTGAYINYITCKTKGQASYSYTLNF